MLGALLSVADPEASPRSPEELADLKVAGLLYLADVLERLRRSG